MAGKRHLRKVCQCIVLVFAGVACIVCVCADKVAETLRFTGDALSSQERFAHAVAVDDDLPAVHVWCIAHQVQEVPLVFLCRVSLSFALPFRAGVRQTRRNWAQWAGSRP